MTRRLHIVCLDVPFPPDYGGASEMFYKIKFLSQQGVRIILHCFEYGRRRRRELEMYCEQVYYYRRRRTFFSSLPYIVASRKNSQLLKRLQNDDLPILLEGTHCTYYLYKNDLNGRNVWVRMHNIESMYYANLYLHAKHPFKKLYYLIESLLLRRYEKLFGPNANFLALSNHDERVLKNTGAATCRYLPLFTDKMEVTSRAGRGDYCLYHGNLSVVENEVAALFLVREVFSGIGQQLTIAGKNPGRKLQRACASAGVRLVPNPDHEQMEKLIANAHVHVLPFFNTTGVKVKWINALFKGRFVVTYQADREEKLLSSLSWATDSSQQLRQTVESLLSTDFSNEEIEKRKKALLSEFDPEVNAGKLISLLFN